MKKILLLQVFFFSIITLFAQVQKPLHPVKQASKVNEIRPIEPAFNLAEKINTQKPTNKIRISEIKVADLSTMASFQSNLKIIAKSSQDLPIFVRGKLSSEARKTSLKKQSIAYLEAIKTDMKISNPNAEFKLLSEETDALGQSHFKYQQTYEGLPVYASQVILHGFNGAIQSMNGRYFKTPNLADLKPMIDAEAVNNLVINHLKGHTNVVELTEAQQSYVDAPSQTLMIYHVDNKPLLVWRIIATPNVLERWEYFVDARTGNVLKYTNTTCTFYPGLDKLSHQCGADHGQAEEDNFSSTLSVLGGTTANARDMKGIMRTINVYEDNGQYVLLDVGRSMFNSSSVIPDNIIGGILTLNGNGTNPSNSNFNATYILSNNNTWQAESVSAHYHAGLCYEYYRTKHNRNSINGKGGNVLSFINVSDMDGSPMDNAFWNGAAMFYGNGNQAFNAPLQKSLDTGGHEMSHGVIGSTANLIYENQPGALNESFADIFGVMIDPVNWQLGEDFANPNIFPSGAMRDMSDPNQGFSNPNTPGWQPKHMNQYQSLPNTPQGDNGGVHVNSGIPNHAFYLFATAVGNAKAERVYYRALTTYLTNSAQFIDCRLAVVQSANDLYGATEANAAKSAFDQVGIFNGNPTDDEPDLETNAGQDYVVMTDGNFSGLWIFDGQNLNALTESDVISRPSVTDDGTAIVFVASDNTLRSLILNQNTNAYEEFYIENNPQQIWRNVAISKDGSKLALLTTDQDNSILIFDYNSGLEKTFEILNSTTAQGVFTDNVEYADVIEWDYSGEMVLYDAYNVLDDQLGNTVDYWDIGLLRVWSNDANNFSDGYPFKLFTGLPENSGIGNPAFAKNSPYIIAFDFIGDAQFFTDFKLLGYNIETGDLNEMFQNDVLSYPHYSVQDDNLLFDYLDNFGDVNLGIVGLGADKISIQGSSQQLIQYGQWGVWFALGSRDLTDTEGVVHNDLSTTVHPNPFNEFLNIDFNSDIQKEVNIRVTNSIGQCILMERKNAIKGLNAYQFASEDWPKGVYYIMIDSGVEDFVKKVVKL